MQDVTLGEFISYLDIEFTDQLIASFECVCEERGLTGDDRYTKLLKTKVIDLEFSDFTYFNSFLEANLRWEKSEVLRIKSQL